MKKNELKNMLKPLIKECVKEVIFEEGALSTIITEVMKGTSGSQQIVETKTQQPKQNFARQERKMQEEKRKSKKRRKTLIKLVWRKLCQYTNIQVMGERDSPNH